jgi:hypothetical protein
MEAKKIGSPAASSEARARQRHPGAERQREREGVDHRQRGEQADEGGAEGQPAAGRDQRAREDHHDGATAGARSRPGR